MRMLSASSLAMPRHRMAARVDRRFGEAFELGQLRYSDWTESRTVVMEILLSRLSSVKAQAGAF